MALKKEKTLENGASGEYWKITNIEVDKKGLKASFTITLWKNKQYSDNGAPAIGTSYIFSSSFTKQQLSGDLFALGYATIKAKVTEPKPNNRIGLLPLSAWDDLSGAVDV